MPRKSRTGKGMTIEAPVLFLLSDRRWLRRIIAILASVSLAQDMAGALIVFRGSNPFTLVTQTG